MKCVVIMKVLVLCFVFQEGNAFVTQLKEMESFNNDLRQACRKVRPNLFREEGRCFSGLANL